ncbi:DUF4232 domain-containing protein [Streptomyces aureocirculatus]|uniref:DUF4232 domain-containing protein n=1 Tax=Streptomyces aureocirculatus TaxID=67275 RepID=UPI0004C4A10A|nr:DUF4232 domain-containing protein [Streptomyces aureocirculatus]
MRNTSRTRTFATLALAAAALTATVSAGTAQAAPAAAGHVTCSAANTEVTVKKVNSPVNHLLLKATNTGGKTCFAYNAPYLRFDDAQSATAVNRDSVPQAVVSLEPGQSAYAGILTSTPQGTHGYQARDLGVSFANRAWTGSVGGSKDLKLPGGGVYLDSSAAVTYWQPNAAAALAW